jgi:hypothetical protein
MLQPPLGNFHSFFRVVRNGYRVCGISTISRKEARCITRCLQESEELQFKAKAQKKDAASACGKVKAHKQARSVKAKAHMKKYNASEKGPLRKKGKEQLQENKAHFLHEISNEGLCIIPGCKLQLKLMKLPKRKITSPIAHRTRKSKPGARRI